MSGFTVAWLDLREVADHRARSGILVDRARAWMRAAGDGALIVDLGAGTGSTLRALHTGGFEAQWNLVDLDADLLQEARRRHGHQVVLQTHVRDLREVQSLPLIGATLVSASALFDLVSREFCEALVQRIAGERSALYVALNYDGHMRWSPEHPLDAAVLAAFNRDQRRDKGFGPALGPEATESLVTILRRTGYTVTVAESPWRLGPDDAALVVELCRGCADAVQGDFRPDDLAEWLRYRLDHAATGACEVGHQDLWAQPAVYLADTDTTGENASTN